MENGKIKFIVAHGERIEVKEIIYFSEYEKYGIDMEFKDGNGRYRRYRSWIDGGKIIREE